MKRSQGTRAGPTSERIRSGLRALAPGALVLCLAPRAHADDLPPTRLDYRVPPECPGIDEFSERVRRRSARIRLVDEGGGLKTLVVEVVAERDTLKSSVRIVEIDGTERTRHLKAKDCNEAIDGLALIATVSLDPEAILEPAAEQPDEPPARPAPKPAETKPKKADAPIVRPPPKRPEKQRWRGGAGLEGTLLHGVAPAVFVGGSALGWIEYRTDHWFFSPLLRGSFNVLPTTARVRAPSGVADFDMPFSATIDACVVRAGTESQGAWLCGFFLGGQLKSEGWDTEDPGHFDRAFGAVGGSALAVLSLWEPLEIVLDVRVGAPLRRDRFQFLPEGPFFEMGMTLSFGLGLAVGFP